ncbi:MAG: hypothetical protein JRD04_02520 [Deltaproteobacteria bacterium]|nr:hypothetical protein [Deltaproteobacteria bacterium]
MPFITGVSWISVNGMGRGREDTDFLMAPGVLPPMSRKAVFESPYSRFGRMDEFSRLGVSAIGLALKDAGMDAWTAKRAVGIVVSTGYGCLHTDVAYFETTKPENGAFASPALFSYTLPNCFLGEAATRFGLTGSGYVITEQNDSGLSSLHAVLEDMACNEFESALAGICDLGCPPGFPVDANVIPGAAFVMVEKTPGMGLKPYGSLRLNPAQEIFFNKTKVSDFSALIKTCVNQIPGS